MRMEEKELLARYLKEMKPPVLDDIVCDGSRELKPCADATDQIKSGRIVLCETEWEMR